MAGAAIEVGVEDAVGVVEAGMELESTAFRKRDGIDAMARSTHLEGPLMGRT